MTNSELARVIASIFALAAFAVAVIAGLAADNSAARVLGIAVGAMVVCHFIGLWIGAIGQRVVAEHLSKVKSAAEAKAPPAAAPAPTS